MKASKTINLQKDLPNLYKIASHRHDWKNSTYVRLLSEDTNQQKKLSRYRWESMLAYYHVELLNFPGEEERIYAGLVSFTCAKTGLTPERVQEIFNYKPRRAIQSDVQMPSLIVSQGKESTTKTISCGSISYDISTKTYNNFGKDPLFLLTFLNYSFLNPESGLFWSIGLALYNELETKNIKTLECFASPFNYHLKEFCSVFSTDRLLRYPEGVTCHGDFFSYIELLKKHDDPVRLILNPPYTDRVISEMAKQVISYLKVRPNSDFIAILPNWTPQDGIESLLALPGSVSHAFAQNEFFIYDAINQKHIKPVGMTLLVIVNIGGDTEESQELLERAVKAIQRT